MTFHCEWVRDDDTECGAPASWETDDLGEVHHLCDACSVDALRCNDFRVEAST